MIDAAAHCAIMRCRQITLATCHTSVPLLPNRRPVLFLSQSAGLCRAGGIV